MSEKKNNKIIESFNNCHSISKIGEILNLQKNDPVISADELYEKAIEICGLGEIKLGFYDISVNVRKISKLIDQYPGYGYEVVYERLNDDRKNFLKQLIDNIGSLNEALILFNEISDFDACISPDEGSLLILLDKKIGSFCLDKNNIRGILSELSGFLKNDWKESSRVEISKFYSRIFEKFSVVFFIGIKNCEDFSTAVKYLECIYFNLPSGFKVTEGMNKIISSEELINKFAELCSKDSSDINEISARVKKISNFIISIEEQNTKTEYFCDQLEKRSGCSPAKDDITDNNDNGFEQIGFIDDSLCEKTFSDVLSYPENDHQFTEFISYCKSKNAEKNELFYIANAVRLITGDDLDSLPDPVSSDDDAVLWGRSFYRAVYDSYINDAEQFYIVSSFSEGMPAVCKMISEFIRRYFEERKETITKMDFAAVCIAYPNSVSSPYYIDAEKGLKFVAEKNSDVLTGFINFCLDYDFTQYPIVVHIVNNNSGEAGWEAAEAEFGGEDPDEDEENDDRSGLNRGIWFVVFLIILLLAAAAYYFFFYLRSQKDPDPVNPVNTTISHSVDTSTTLPGTVESSYYSEAVSTGTEVSSPSSITVSESGEVTATASTIAATVTTDVHNTTEADPAKTTSKTTATSKTTSTTTKTTAPTAKTTAATKTTSVESKPTQKNTETTGNSTIATTAVNPVTTETVPATTEAVKPTTAEATIPQTTVAVETSAVADTTKPMEKPTESPRVTESSAE